ncbi:hypothetical protein BH23GEM9_BH23GEM9_28450 [soil metagenome]
MMWTQLLARMLTVLDTRTAPAALSVFAMIAMFATPAAPAAAQDVPPPTQQALPAPQQCTYDECALRIRAPTLTTPMKLVRGREAVDVVQLGLLHPAIEPFVQLSDSAAAYARTYDTLFDRGSVISLAGTAIAIVAPIAMRGTMQKIAFTGVGIGFTVVGGVITNRANEALSKAIWWYNREVSGKE